MAGGCNRVEGTVVGFIIRLLDLCAVFGGGLTVLRPPT